MKLELQIKMNDDLFVKDPKSSDIGRKILENSIVLIYESGFESFTFKKLANCIGSTEASIYRYFENKHKLLVYLTSWYWQWLEFQISFQTNNLNDPTIKLKKIIKLLVDNVEENSTINSVNERRLHTIVISEGSKTYLTKQINEENKQHFFKPYKDLCSTISNVILEYNPKYKFPKSLSSTLIEMSHYQTFFMNNLPSLTDFGISKSKDDLIAFLKDLVFSSIAKR